MDVCLADLLQIFHLRESCFRVFSLLQCDLLKVEHFEAGELEDCVAAIAWKFCDEIPEEAQSGYMRAASGEGVDVAELTYTVVGKY